ncbi:MAG: hypothetical protein KJI72_01190 [Patescibacteria group bacterium]|nr:hypothetical protein [Patescibacteria group bacterium]
MVKVRNFHEELERSLERLGQQIETERQHSETKALPERELVKRSIKSFSSSVTTKDNGGTPPEDVPSAGESELLPTYLQGEGVDSRVKLEVERLVDLVFHKGLEKALKEASKHSPFIEDAFHDALVDKLLPELKKKGILK